jgi:hypothetical protein
MIPTWWERKVEMRIWLQWVPTSIDHDAVSCEHTLLHGMSQAEVVVAELCALCFAWL